MAAVSSRLVPLLARAIAKSKQENSLILEAADAEPGGLVETPEEDALCRCLIQDQKKRAPSIGLRGTPE